MERTPSPYFIRRTIAVPEEDIVFEEAPEVGADEEMPLFWEYWRILNKRRWLIAACALAGILGAGLYAFTSTPFYTGEATIMIERKPSQVVGMEDAFAVAAVDERNADYLTTQEEILKKPAFAARAIRESSLENDRLFKEGAGKSDHRGFFQTLATNIGKRLRRVFAGLFPPTPNDDQSGNLSVNRQQLGVDPDLVSYYLSVLDVAPVRRTSLFEISFTTPYPGLSARMANAHADAYMDYGLDLRAQANQEALVFLQDKLLELKDRVESSEAALNNYRRQKGIITLDEGGNLVVHRLIDLNNRLTEAEAQRIALESEVQLIRAENYDALPRVRRSPIISTFKSELGRLEGEYAKLAGEFKAGYTPLDTLKLNMEEIRKRLRDEIESEVAAIRAAYEAAQANEKELRARMEEQKKVALNLKDAAVQYAILAREVDTNRQLYDSVLQRMKEMGVAAQVQDSNVSIIQRALVPDQPSYPRRGLTLLLGLLLGLAGGTGLAFFLDHIDTTLKTPDEAERYLGLSSLGVVPDFSELKHKSNGYLSGGGDADNGAVVQSRPERIESPSDFVLSHDPRSVVAESYRTLRTAILFSRAGARPRTILFTSATRGEGKSATAINTSVIFAQMGYRVIVIDADLRRPRGHKLLGMNNVVGLSNFLTGQRTLNDVTVPTSEENLYFAGSGTTPPNPSELLGSPKMEQLLTELREEFDCVIIDSPPIMPVSDPILLSTMVDGVVLVINSRATPKQLVREARSRLRKADAKILGIVLNRIDLQNGDYSGYYSHYFSYDHDS